MNTKLHAVTDTVGRPIQLFMTAGQVSDYTGARALVKSLPAANCLLGDRGYDADWFREALADNRSQPKTVNLASALCLDTLCEMGFFL